MGIFVTDSQTELNLITSLSFPNISLLSLTLANIYTMALQRREHYREHYNFRNLACKPPSHLYHPQSGRAQHAAKVCVCQETQLLEHFTWSHAYFKQYVLVL